MRASLCYFGDSFVGSNRSYVYILFTVTQRCLYVGQTAEQGGAIGRLSSHLSKGGTFRQRLEERGVDLDEIADLRMFVFTLPEDHRYIGIDRAHREAVEYLVQRDLRAVSGLLQPYMRVISNVAYNDAATLTDVCELAKELVNSFLVALPGCGVGYLLP